MFVAIITRMRYFGGGFGFIDSRRRTKRLKNPRGFLRPDSSVEQGLQRAHAAAAAAHPCAHDEAADAPDLGCSRLERSVPPPQLGTRVLGHVVERVAARVERKLVAVAPAAAALGELTAVAERVGLVEEHDHAAVAQGELAQLAEERLHLEDADPEEHVRERARVDEDERLAGLTGDRFGHERLAGAGRPPQQDAGRARGRPCSRSSRGPRGTSRSL